MRKNKILALCLSALMVAGLAGCGGSSSTASSTASSAAGSTASSAAAEAPDGDGDPTTLTVAMECAYAPYNWTQTTDENGAVQIRDSSDYAYGYDVMMAKKIAEALGQEVQIVKLDWDSLVPAVMSGDVDCVIAGQSITSERAQQVDFSDPLLLRLHRHPGEEGQPLRFRRQRGRPGRRHLHQPAGHHLV